MIDVLGISLIRLLAVCQENNYDIKNPSLSGTGKFKKLFQHYRELEHGRYVTYIYKCPVHNTYLQSEDGPFPHYSCWFWEGCTYKKEIEGT